MVIVQSDKVTGKREKVEIELGQNISLFSLCEENNSKFLSPTYLYSRQ